MDIKAFFRGFKGGMHDFGSLIAGIINTILLLVVYIFGVGLTALIAKLLGKRFLELSIDPKRKSYWTKLDLGKRSAKDYYRQF